MLSNAEKIRLRDLLKQMQDYPGTRNKEIDVSNRKRDKIGRFLPNGSSSATKEVSQLKSDKPRKVIKVKGSYNSI